MRKIPALSLAFLFAAMPAWAELATCVGGKGIAATTVFSTLPPELQSGLEMLVPGIQAAGTIPNGPRFIEGFHRANRWAVGYVTGGGSAGAYRIAVFDLADGRALLRNTRPASPSGICMDMMQLLNGL